MNEELKKYQTEIEGMAAFLKRTNFDFSTGDFMDAMKQWARESVTTFQNLSNKESIEYQIVSGMIKKTVK